VRAGLRRAKAEGKQLGRRIAPEIEQRILSARKGSLSVRKTAPSSASTRISHPFAAASAA